jgi:hypothetical protein
MNHLLKISLLIVPLLAVPSRAHATCWDWLPLKIDHGFEWSIRSHWHFNLGGCGGCGSGGCQGGPWYSYWPYEAHFQTGAPVDGCYPYWGGNSFGAAVGGAVAYPGGSTTPQQTAPAPTTPQQTPPAPQPLQPSASFQPAGYYGQAPGYGFGR